MLLPAAPRLALLLAPGALLWGLGMPATAWALAACAARALPRAGRVRAPLQAAALVAIGLACVHGAVTTRDAVALAVVALLAPVGDILLASAAIAAPLIRTDFAWPGVVAQSAAGATVLLLLAARRTSLRWTVPAMAVATVGTFVAMAPPEHLVRENVAFLLVDGALAAWVVRLHRAVDDREAAHVAAARRLPYLAVLFLVVAATAGVARGNLALAGAAALSPLLVVVPLLGLAMRSRSVETRLLLPAFAPAAAAAVAVGPWLGDGPSLPFAVSVALGAALVALAPWPRPGPALRRLHLPLHAALAAMLLAREHLAVTLALSFVASLAFRAGGDRVRATCGVWGAVALVAGLLSGAGLARSVGDALAWACLGAGVATACAAAHAVGSLTLVPADHASRWFLRTNASRPPRSAAPVALPVEPA